MSRAEQGGGGGLVSVTVKLLFVAAVVMQVVLWPSAVSILFASVYAVTQVCALYAVAYDGKGVAALLRPGPFLLQTAPITAYSYAFLGVMACYFGGYFGLFVAHELDLQPAVTTWLDPSMLAAPALGGNSNGSAAPLWPAGGLGAVAVDGATSQAMRANPFTWPKHVVQAPAPSVVGTVPGAGAAGAALVCAAGLPFACFAKLLQVGAPPAGLGGHPFVPLAEPFYAADVRVTPPAGVACADVEVYRVVLDPDRNVVHGLDYPSSVVVPLAQQRAAVYSPACGLFGAPLWCLQLSHTFTDAQYRAQVAARCAAGGGSLVFQLPARAPDVDYATGRAALDLLVVTAGAAVELHAGWRPPVETGLGWFWSPWRQITYADLPQAWRESSADGDVFVKFAVAVLPLLVVWYQLAANFRAVVPGCANSTVLELSVFVLTPAIMLFLSIGAWVPMAGCLVCVLAVNHPVSDLAYAQVVRSTLLFLTAACNSIQVAWLLSLVATAGYSAFYYEATLQQLYTLSDRFIITDTASPTWTALVLPTVMLVDVAFFAVSAWCLVKEMKLPASTRRAVAAGA